jgi:hypothetical protein
MTEAMEKITGMLINTDNRLKDFGVMEYGTRKASQTEQRQRFENLSTEELTQMIERYGKNEVNKFLGRFMEE